MTAATGTAARLRRRAQTEPGRVAREITVAPPLLVAATLCSLAAGLIDLAVAAGAPGAWAPLLAGIGVIMLAWSVWALARGGIVAARFMLGFALAGTAAWAIGLAIGLGTPPAAPMATASLFGFVVAIVCGFAHRAARSGGARMTRGRSQRQWPFVVSLIVGAFVVAALTAPALAGARGAGTEPSPMPGMHMQH